MKKIDLFTFKSFIGPFFLTLFIAMFILLMQFLWKYIQDIVGKGLEWTVIVELLTYASATLVPMALPLAILLASLMTFGSLGENYELTALKSSGISLWRIFFPLIAFTIIISIGAFFFSNDVLPYSTLKLKTLMFDMRNKRPDIDFKPGAFYNDIENYSIKIGSKDQETGLLKDFIIYDHSNNKGNKNITIADSGYMYMGESKTHMTLKLFNGQTYTEIEDKKENKRKREKHYNHRRDIFEEQTFLIELEGFDLSRSDADLFRKNHSMLDLKQLEYTSDSLTEILRAKQDDFVRSLVNKNLMKKERKNDTTFSYDTLKRVYVLSKLEDLPLNQQKRALEEAIKYSKSAQSYIKNTEKGLSWRQRTINRYLIEWHRKYTLSIACFVFFFIGAPLGSIIRKGGLGMPTVISIFFFIFYYIITLTGDKMARGGILSPFGGMWLSTYIFFPIGVFLTYKATTDSSLFNTEMYVQGIKKSFRKITILFKRKYIHSQIAKHNA